MPSSLRRDIVSAYLVTASRIVAWITVTATVSRAAGAFGFGLLALVNSTVGILEYAAIGLSPAIIRVTAEALQKVGDDGSESPAESHRAHPLVTAVYANGFAMALLTALAGGVFLAIFVAWYKTTPSNRESGNVAFELVLMVGAATLIRMLGDAAGAVLQTRHQIFLDNLLLTMHEIIWSAGTVICLTLLHWHWQRATGVPLLVGSILLLVLRLVFSHRYGSGLFDHWWKFVDWHTLRRLLIFGGLVVAAQMADYLYAPTDYLIIGKLIDIKTLGNYAPAVLIDTGTLTISSALSTVLLPRTALAHAAGQGKVVRQYYLRGTIATFGLLLIAAPILWLAAPMIFKIWLGNPMPVTCAILPLMLIHTVVGGSSAVGRAILLAIGKVKPFTTAVLISGVVNVILSYSFVKFLHLGLRGIVLGTIAAVVGRCGVWMPWYVLKVLKESEEPDRPAL